MIQVAEQLRDYSPLVNLGGLLVLAGALVRMGGLKRQVEHHEDELRRRASIEALEALKERIEGLHQDVREIRDYLRRNGHSPTKGGSS